MIKIDPRHFLPAPIEHVTWMGGSPPRPFPEISVEEYQYAMEIYFDDVRIWEDYWSERVSRDLADLFWNRARHDAHATFRDL